MSFNNLFKEGKIGNLNLKNRIVLPAMGTSLASSTGEASDEIIAYYEERAKGGCGLIITEITRVDNESGVGTPNQLAAISGIHGPRLERLVRSVHKYDSKIFLQLHHPGRQTKSALMDGRPVKAPSSIPCPTIGEEPQEFTTEEVQTLVNKFVIGAKIAQNAGVDGVELHGAHGYLIHQFLSPNTNKRTDKYGGSFENRLNFLKEIIFGIKSICGPDFPISVRINGSDFLEDGIIIDDAIKIAKSLESFGADAINVSSGTYATAYTIIEPNSYKEGWKKDFSKAIKENISIPVISCNALKSPKAANDLIKENYCDFVALGRAQLADSHWSKKAKTGIEKSINPCIGCLHCIESLMTGHPIQCVVNPRLGYENIYSYGEYNRDGDNRLVTIIGGGPAGLQASHVLAERGFKVILFEKESKLGGSAYLGGNSPEKEQLKLYIDTMEFKALNLGVEIRTNTSPSIDQLKKLNPYGIFIATGGLDFVPANVELNDKVLLPKDILFDKIELSNKNIAIIGSGLTGLELAEYLGLQNNKIHLIEMADTIGPGIYGSVLYDMHVRLKGLDINFMPKHRFLSTKGNNVLLRNTEDDSNVELPVDLTILSIGIKDNKNSDFIKDLKSNFENVVLLGDVAKPGNISGATKSAFDKAYILE